jgi:flagellar basal body-associated protein FliL
MPTGPENQGLLSGGASPKPDRINIKPLLIVLAAFLLLLAIGSTGLFLWRGKQDRGLVATKPEEAVYIAEYDLRKQQAADIINKDAKPLYSQVFDYTVNMKNGQNMMRFAFRALLFDVEARDFLAGIKPAVDHMMLELLQQLNPEDLRSRAGLEILKRSIHLAMNAIYPSSFIERSKTRDRMPVKDILIIQYYIN